MLRRLRANGNASSERRMHARPATSDLVAVHPVVVDRESRRASSSSATPASSAGFELGARAGSAVAHNEQGGPGSLAAAEAQVSQRRDHVHDAGPVGLGGFELLVEEAGEARVDVLTHGTRERGERVLGDGLGLGSARRRRPPPPFAEVPDLIRHFRPELSTSAPPVGRGDSRWKTHEKARAASAPELSAAGAFSFLRVVARSEPDERDCQAQGRPPRSSRPTGTSASARTRRCSRTCSFVHDSLPELAYDELDTSLVVFGKRLQGAAAHRGDDGRDRTRPTHQPRARDAGRGARLRIRARKPARDVQGRRCDGELRSARCRTDRARARQRRSGPGAQMTQRRALRSSPVPSGRRALRALEPGPGADPAGGRSRLPRRARDARAPVPGAPASRSSPRRPAAGISGERRAAPALGGGEARGRVRGRRHVVGRRRDAAGGGDARELGETFREWGIPTAASVASVSGHGFETVFAPGGIATGSTSPRPSRSAPRAGGFARPVLQALESGGRAAARGAPRARRERAPHRHAAGRCPGHPGPTARPACDRRRALHLDAARRLSSLDLDVHQDPPADRRAPRRATRTPGGRRSPRLPAPPTASAGR